MALPREANSTLPPGLPYQHFSGENKINIADLHSNVRNMPLKANIMITFQLKKYTTIDSNWTLPIA